MIENIENIVNIDNANLAEYNAKLIFNMIFKAKHKSIIQDFCFSETNDEYLLSGILTCNSNTLDYYMDELAEFKIINTDIMNFINIKELNCNILSQYNTFRLKIGVFLNKNIDQCLLSALLKLKNI